MLKLIGMIIGGTIGDIVFHTLGGAYNMSFSHFGAIALGGVIGFGVGELFNSKLSGATSILPFPLYPFGPQGLFLL